MICFTLFAQYYLYFTLSFIVVILKCGLVKYKNKEIDFEGMQDRGCKEIWSHNLEWVYVFLKMFWNKKVPKKWKSIIRDHHHNHKKNCVHICTQEIFYIYFIYIFCFFFKYFFEFFYFFQNIMVLEFLVLHYLYIYSTSYLHIYNISIFTYFIPWYYYSTHI